MASDRAVLLLVAFGNVGDVAFSIFVLSTKNLYSSILKKLFIFKKICFKVKVLETFNISSDSHKKHVILCKHMRKVRTSKVCVSIDSCMELRKTQFSGKKSIVKDTHRKKAPINKAPALTESINKNIWAVGTSNQLFMRGF